MAATPKWTCLVEQNVGKLHSSLVRKAHVTACSVWSYFINCNSKVYKKLRKCKIIEMNYCCFYKMRSHFDQLLEDVNWITRLAYSSDVLIVLIIIMLPLKEVNTAYFFQWQIRSKGIKKNRSLEELSFYRLLGMFHSITTIFCEVCPWLCSSSTSDPSSLFSFTLCLFSLHPLGRCFSSSSFLFPWGNLIKLTGPNVHSHIYISRIVADTSFPKF